MKTFHPNCTLPSEPSFVSAPNARGTLSIVWSCISVLILCTWSIQFPNLPIQVRCRTRRQMLRYQLYQASRKLWSMCFAVTAPEYFAAVAVEELVFASRFTRKFRNIEILGEESPAQWSLAHTFLAQMGGFQIRFSHLPLVETAQLDSSGYSQSHVLDHAQIQGPGSPEPKFTDGDQMLLQPLIAQEEPLIPHTILPGDMVLPFDDARPRPDTTSYATSLHHTSLDNERSFNQASVPSKLSTRSMTTPSKEMLQEEATAWLSNEAVVRGVVDPVILAGNLSSKYGYFFWNPIFQVEVSNAMKDTGRTPLDKAQAQTALFLQGDVWVLDAAQLFKAHEIGLVANLPDSTEEELKDKSKSDVLIKALALAQGMWLIIQVISRSVWTPTLHTSQLEIGTIAVALCMLPTYVAFWHKPQNVSTALVVHASRAPTRHDVTTIAREGSSSLGQDSFHIPSGGTNAEHAHRVPYLGDMELSAILLIIFGSLLGAIHFAAWNYAFPTPAEIMLWKIATCISTGLPIMFGCLVYTGFEEGTSGTWLFSGIMTIYAIARFCIVVEMFRCLYYLPPSAYVATWASEIPSVA